MTKNVKTANPVSKIKAAIEAAYKEGASMPDI